MFLRTFYVPQYKRERKLWGPGPWEREPDVAQFWHAGIRCEVGRARLGHWCGYVIVKEEHPWHGQANAADIDVHGGVTYARPDADGTWRMGFDCGHFGDLMPFGQNHIPLLGRGFSRRMRRMSSRWGGTYRTMAWVIDETRRLAEQAREAST